MFERRNFGIPAKRVNKIEPDTGKVLETYDSVNAAARSLGKISARAPISYVCRGLAKTAYGFKWEYAD